MDSIQFHTAEFADNTPKCSACRTAIPREFYQLAGHNICSNCAEVVRRHQELPNAATFSRGLVYGAGAAFACFLGYTAIMLVTGLQIGLIAIAVGYLVGMAVRKGSSGLGGRRCQIAAVALTYFAITFSYIPVGIRDYMNTRTKEEAAADKSATAKAPPASAAGIATTVVVLSGLALVTPFLGLASGSGIIGIAILIFGLQRAWQVTARDERALTGPFQREEASPVGG